jgi:Na+/proline symporter
MKKEKKSKRKLKARTKLVLLQTFGAIALFLPLAIGIALNFNDYIKTPASAVSLSLGGMCAVIVVSLQMLKKGKKIFGNAVIVSGIIFGLTILLEPLILNLKFLVGLVFAGEVIYAVAFKSLIARYKKKADYADEAEAFGGNTDKIVEAIKSVFNGRV